MGFLSRREFVGTVSAVGIGAVMADKRALAVSSKVTLTFKQVCLVLRKGPSTLVVFPRIGHELLLGTTPVSGRIEVVVRDEDGRRLDAGETLGLSTDYVPTLSEVVGTQVRPKSEKDIATLAAAIIVLGGGSLVTGPAVAPADETYAEAQWAYGSWRGRLTNWIQWECPSAPGKSYSLERNDRVIASIPPDRPCIIHNSARHLIDEGTETEVFASEFDTLFDFGKGNFIKRPVILRTARIHTFGWGSPTRPLCPVGQLIE